MAHYTTTTGSSTDIASSLEGYFTALLSDVERAALPSSPTYAIGGILINNDDATTINIDTTRLTATTIADKAGTITIDNHATLHIHTLTPHSGAVLCMHKGAVIVYRNIHFTATAKCTLEDFRATENAVSFLYQGQDFYYTGDENGGPLEVSLPPAMESASTVVVGAQSPFYEAYDSAC